MRKRTVVLLVLMILLLAGTVGAYTAIAMYYDTHFFEYVTINGIDVSDLTASEAEALIAAEAEDYSITVTTREGTQETISGEAIGYEFVSGGEVAGFLQEQNGFAWLPAYLGGGAACIMETSMTYDEPMLAAAVSSLACMQEEQMTAPTDAYVAQQADGTYGIVEETQGSQLDPAQVVGAVAAAVESGVSEVDLDGEGCYNAPAVYSTDGALKAQAAIMNRYSSMVITYYMGGDATVTLDWSTVSNWFSLSADNEPSIDLASVTAWVDQLADTYDTIGAYLPFVTSNGATVYVESVTYGWQMDRGSEASELYSLLLSGDSAERSPVWLESAGTRGANDIGNTYVEIDYTNQRMWYYKDGVLLVETPVVTGNVSAGTASPEGVFCIVYKQEDAILVGEDYKTPVEYWMPFYGGVGIHDADSWRTVYGGSIYMTSGSHGCINTPTAQAAVIYENITAGTPVICYSSGIDYGYSQVTVDGSAVSSGSGTASGDSADDIVIIDGSGDILSDAAGIPSDTAGSTDAAADVDISSDIPADTSANIPADTPAGSDTSQGDEDIIIIY